MLRVKINSLRPSLTSYSKMQKCNNIQNNKKGEPNLKNAENCLDNGEHYNPVEIIPADAISYEDVILAAIAKENRFFESARGLAEYIHDEALNEKVYSLYPSVEIVDGELWGVMTAGLKESLSGEEIAELLDFVTGQNSDGYGEGLEQRPIKTHDGEIYVSFWNHENYSLKLEPEIKNNSSDLGYRGPVTG